MTQLIIFLTRDTLILPQASFTWQAGGTIADQFVFPRSAGAILGIRDTRYVKALRSTSAQLPGPTYGFTWGDNRSYRALDWPGGPAVLVAEIDHPHWAVCKPCRDGVWCGEGLSIILDAHATQGGAHDAGK